MKPFHFPRTLLAAGAALLILPLFASAHPGHEHSDIPAVIRHPFAGVEHVAVVATLVAAAVGVTMLALKVWRASSRHGVHSRIARLR